MANLVAERIALVKGDITGVQADVIVNAANSSLLGGGGVDGRIHHVAGPQLLEECKTLGGCNTGDAKITAGYNLLAKHVIHTVGPVYRNGKSGEPELLASCYRKSLALAKQHRLQSIAFPAISCGVYHYPVEAAAMIAFREVIAFLRTHAEPAKVFFVLYDQPAYEIYRNLFCKLVQSETRK